jgi:hypothetical protein
MVGYKVNSVMFLAKYSIIGRGVLERGSMFFAWPEGGRLTQVGLRPTLLGEVASSGHVPWEMPVHEVIVDIHSLGQVDRLHPSSIVGRSMETNLMGPRQSREDEGVKGEIGR